MIVAGRAGTVTAEEEEEEEEDNERTVDGIGIAMTEEVEEEGLVVILIADDPY